MDEIEPEPPGRPLLPPAVAKQLESRPLFDANAPYGKVLAPFAALFTWMLISGWAANSLKQKVGIGAVVAFMWLVVFALLIPRRARWAPRVVTALVGAAYSAFVLHQAWTAITDLRGGRTPTLGVLQALAGFIIFGMPSLYFARHGRFPWTVDRAPAESDELSQPPPV